MVGRGVLPLALALALLAGCGLQHASALRDPDMRAEVAGRVVATLDEQDHYFPDGAERREFLNRIDLVVHATNDATTFYRGVSDALATLREGHTGLVASNEVPFGTTIPPVAILEVGGLPVVAGVAPGVEGGGLRPGDVILEVDGAPAGEVLERQLRSTPGSTPHGRRARAVANLLAGPTHAPCVVCVRGWDGRERICFPLRFLLDDEGCDRFRFGFQSRTVNAARLSPGTLYLALPDFHPDRYAELEAALDAVGTLPIVVLDLRGNPGGRIRTLQRVAGLFLGDASPLLQLVEGPRTETLHAIPGALHCRSILRLLVDERTGSAAELLAAALQDTGRAAVYGRPTAGSARSRRSSRLPGDVVFHYAGRTEFRHLDGRAVEGEGIRPDMGFAPTREDLARGEYGDPFRDPAVRFALGLN